MYSVDELDRVEPYNGQPTCDVMKTDVTQAASSAGNSPPFSEKARLWPWNKYLNESDVGLFTDSTTELSGLVEDKEIAARAVAFVVNSTRKGIVPLCADVANLMRSKQILERKLYQLRRESETYRSSGPGSVPSLSMSPTPPSLGSYTENCIKALQEQSLAVQEQYRSRSRCSNTDSTNSYSPKLDLTRRHLLAGVQGSPISSHDNRKHGSPRSIHTINSEFRSTHRADSSCPIKYTGNVSNKQAIIPNEPHLQCNPTTDSVDINKDTNNSKHPADKNSMLSSNDNDVIVTSAFTFHLEDETKGTERALSGPDDNQCDRLDEEDEDYVEDEAENEEQIKCGSKSLLERRRVSLPEITTVPNLKAIKIRPKQSKHVQCCLDTPGQGMEHNLEDQFLKSVRLNAKLEQDLDEARKEIEKLKSRLKRLESSGAIPKATNATADDDDDKITEDNGYYTGSNRTSRTGSEHERTRGQKKPITSKGRPAVTPSTYGGPLSSCRCSSCQVAMGSVDDLSPYPDQNTHEPTRFAVNSKLQIQLNDHVMIKGDYSGYIRYIGHVDGIDQSNTLYVGLECDTTVGTHDGSYGGKRYFYCKKNQGMFALLNDVVCKVSKKTQIKTIKDELLKLRKHTKRS